MSEVKAPETKPLNETAQKVSDVFMQNSTFAERDVEGSISINLDDKATALLWDAVDIEMSTVKKFKKAHDNLMLGSADAVGKSAAQIFEKDKEAKQVRSTVNNGFTTHTSNVQRTATINAPSLPEPKVVPGYQSNSVKVAMPKTALKAVGSATSYRVAALND